jgi:hypothetical protein
MIKDKPFIFRISARLIFSILILLTASNTYAAGLLDKKLLNNPLMISLVCIMIILLISIIVLSKILIRSAKKSVNDQGEETNLKGKVTFPK